MLCSMQKIHLRRGLHGWLVNDREHGPFKNYGATKIEFYRHGKRCGMAVYGVGDVFQYHMDQIHGHVKNPNVLKTHFKGSAFGISYRRW